MKRHLAVIALLGLAVVAPAFAQRHHAVVPPVDSANLPMSAQQAAVGGIVQTVSGSLITIANGTITIDASHATIRNLQGDTIALSAIRAGDRIDASAATDNVAAGAPIVATRITVARIDVVSLAGTVQSIDVNRLTFTILGRTIAIASDTKFAGVKSLADVKTGDRLFVTSELRDRLTALTVFDMRSITPPDAKFMTNVIGNVKTIGATMWVITSDQGDVALLVDSHTLIFPGIVVGDRVFATAINTTTPPTAIIISKVPPGSKM
jgi:hypothetical protein